MAATTANIHVYSQCRNGGVRSYSAKVQMMDALQPDQTPSWLLLLPLAHQRDMAALRSPICTGTVLGRTVAVLLLLVERVPPTTEAQAP